VILNDNQSVNVVVRSIIFEENQLVVTEWLNKSWSFLLGGGLTWANISATMKDYLIPGLAFYPTICPRTWAISLRIAPGFYLAITLRQTAVMTRFNRWN